MPRQQLLAVLMMSRPVASCGPVMCAEPEIRPSLLQTPADRLVLAEFEDLLP
jgi:hypothetical protein